MTDFLEDSEPTPRPIPADDTPESLRRQFEQILNDRRELERAPDGFWKGFGIAAVLMLILSLLLGFGFSLYQATAAPTNRTRSTENAAEYFVKKQAEGLAKLSQEVVDKLDADEFDDIADLRDFWKPRKTEIEDSAKQILLEELELINGEKWDVELAKEIFKDRAKGFRRAAK